MGSKSTVAVVSYDPTWPVHFQQISEKLENYLSASSVNFSSIEHVGSTAVPGLAAKPNIDIIIVVPNARNAEKAKEVLMHEPPPEDYYKCIGDGGIMGRISMKFQNRALIPDRSVYIVNEEDPKGKIIMRCHRDLRDTLKMPQHKVLRDAYGKLKFELAASSLDLVEYGKKKDSMIRMILKVAGWSDTEIDDKEALDYRIPDDEDPY